MEYKFEEYERAMDTPKKKLEERAVVEKIISILNENKKYQSLEDFYKDNTSLDDFKKNNNLENVFKHFGNKLTQEDYVKIIQNLRLMIEKKSTFDKEGIKTTDIENKQYVSYNGENNDYFLTNSYSSNNIEDQMENIQKENSLFQTSDTKKNTELMMQELQKKKKISLLLRYLNEINFEVLNQEQQNLFKFVFDYQKNNNGLIRLDLDEQVMVDEDNNILKIDKIGGDFVVTKGNEKYSDNSNELSQNNKDDKTKENETNKSFKLKQKTQLFS